MEDDQRPGPEPTASSAGIQTAELRSRALALMFAAGAVLAVVTLVLPGAGGLDRIPWAVNASLGLPVAAALHRWGRLAPEPVLHLVLVLGAVLVASGMTFGNGGSITVAASFLFIWVSLYVFLFFDRPVAITHMLLDAVLLHSALVATDVQAAASVTLLVVGTAAIVGTVTSATRTELFRLATTDPLTGLANRRRLQDALTVETARSIRSAAPYSVAIIDLDDLKAVNDRHGHRAGDRLLIDSARAWQSCLRPTDVLVRYGGDEFVAVLPSSDATQARLIADRLQAGVPAPCSIGVATWQPEEEPDAVLQRADEHLYASKRSGGGLVTSDEGQARPS